MDIPVREHIESTLMRCRSMGINSKIEKAPVLTQKKPGYLKQPHIKRIRDKSIDSLHNFKYLENFFEYVITITDEKGTIIHIDGYENFLQEVKDYGVTLGGCWNESCMGNNAMGTALKIQKPIFFIGDEHIVEIAHQYACAAAPFYNIDSNSLLGCVNISCREKDFHITLMLAVMAISESIQQRIAHTSRKFYDSISLKENQPSEINGKTKEEFVNTSQPMRAVFSKARRAALFDSTKMILGETGVGKEVLAKFIHNNSPRANKPFVAVNCGAIPRELVECELFGYNAGSFTGAKRDGNTGKFELANGGTIFLDEIGEMAYDTQATLLRIIEDKKVIRLGASYPIPLDVQIITSTNRDLKRMVKEKKFREDLFYRLKVAQFFIPPLRERREAIPNLTRYLLDKIANRFGMPIKTVSDSAMNSLIGHHWPGNIRELEHILEEAYIFSKETMIDIDDLNEDIFMSQFDSNLHEKDRIIAEIERCNGNMTKVAATLNIARVTLYRKMSKYGIPLKKKMNRNLPFEYNKENEGSD